MKRVLFRLFGLFAFSCSALAQNYPAPQEGTWVVRDFKFHTGEVLPELKLHYRTIGDKSGEPVIIMHGTTGSGAGFSTPDLRGGAVRAGPAARREALLHHPAGRGRPRPLEQAVRRHGMKFPRYNYDDMVRCAAPPGDRAPRREARAPRDGQLDGRHGDLDLGAEVSRTSWTRRRRWRRRRPRWRAATG